MKPFELLKSACLVTALLLPGVAIGAPADLEGLWAGKGGNVRVEPCVRKKGLCVLVDSGTAGPESMSSMVGNLVGENLVRTGPQTWTGLYVAEGAHLKMTVTLKNPNRAEMRVCALSWFPWALCETPIYTRVVK